MRSLKTILLVISTCLCFNDLCSQCQGDVFTFTNGKGNGLFSDPLNWDLEHVPGPLDCVESDGHDIIYDLPNLFFLDKLDISNGRFDMNANTSLTFTIGNFDNVETLINQGAIFNFINSHHGFDWDLENYGKIECNISPVIGSDPNFSIVGDAIVNNYDSIAGIAYMKWNGQEMTNHQDGIINFKIDSYRTFFNEGKIEGNRSGGLNIIEQGFINRSTGDIIYRNIFNYEDDFCIQVRGGLNAQLTNLGDISIINVNSIFISNRFDAIILRGGTISNQSEILIRDISHGFAPGSRLNGINLFSSGTFLNNGNITLNDFTGVGLRSTIDSVANDGGIWIQNVGNNFKEVSSIVIEHESLLDGRFYNRGLIVNQNSDFCLNVEKDQKFINEGTFRALSHNLSAINTDYDNSIDIFFRGEFINAATGVLDILELETDDWGNAMVGWIENHGVINISNPYFGSSGVFFGNAIQGAVDNYGSIDAELSSGEKCLRGLLYNHEGASLKADGELRIDSIFIISNPYDFTFNEGEVVVTGNLVIDTEDMENRSCGYIKAEVAFGGRSLINDGLLEFNPLGSFLGVPYNITNNGVFFDTRGFYFGRTGYVNNGIHFDTNENTYTCGDEVDGIMDAPNVLNISDPFLTTDEAGLELAGAFDISEETITVGSGFTSASTLYAHFILSEGCTATIKILDSPMTCTGCGEVVWQGSISTDWHEGTNWSTETVPDPCQEVVIPASATNDCIISNNKSGECRLLRVDQNAVFKVRGTLKVHVTN